MNARNFPLTLQPGLWYDRGMLKLVHTKQVGNFKPPRVGHISVLTLASAGAFSVFREAI